MTYFSISIFWIAVTSDYPFTLAHAFSWHPGILLIGLINGIMFLIMLNKSTITFTGPFMIGLLQFVGYLILYFIHNDIFYLNAILRLFPIYITYLFINNIIGLDRIIRSLLFVFKSLSVMTIIAFILVFIGYLHHVSKFVNPDGRIAYNYILTFSNVIITVGENTLIRASSFFDEPGTFAFYIIFLIWINKLTFNNKKTEIILIIGGIITTSLAFYIIIFIYYISFYFRLKDAKYFLITALTLMSLIFYLNQMRLDNPISGLIYSLTIGRLSYVGEDNKVIQGDNRSEALILASKIFSQNPLFGLSPLKIEKNKIFIGANPMGPLAYHGIIGSVIVFLHLIYLFYLLLNPTIWKKGNMIKIKLFVSLLLLYSQRPDVMGYFSYLLVLLMISIVDKHNKKRSGQEFNGLVNKKLYGI